MTRKIYWLTLGLVTLACRGEAPPPADRSSAAGPVDTSVTAGPPAVVFLGTSLTAGLGVDPDSAFPALIQERIDSRGWPFRVVNGGVSGETSAGGLRRLPWLLNQPVAAVVIELGANDGLRGLDIDQLTTNLDSIIRLTAAKHPRAEVVIAGMRAPPDLGPRYTSRFRAVFIDVAARHDAARIPFLLEGVAGVSALNQSDGIHPTVEGHAILAETVWQTLEPVLRRLGSAEF